MSWIIQTVTIATA